MILFRTLLALGLVMAAPVSAQEFPVYDASQFGKIIVAQGQANIPQAQYEALMGSSNIEVISSINPESVIARLGRAVGKLDILTDNGGYAPCTAFLVEKNRLITNYHCIPGVLQHPKVGGTEIVSALFHAGFVRDGSTAGTKTYHVKPTPLEMNQDLDYAVLQILGDANKEFGALELSAAAPKDSEPFVVIGHPQGWALRFSREQCKASSPAVEGNRVLHTCDTLPGSSGSPVISDDSRQVIALHSAAAGSVNLAVPMAQILGQSEILKAAVPAKPAVATIAPKADPCDPQFALAKQVNQCAVWDGYLASCRSHSKASEARRLQARACKVDACDGQFEKAKASNSCDGWKSYAQACGNHDGIVVAEMAVELTCKPVAEEKPAEKSQPSLEESVGSYNNESIRNYSPDSVFARMGQAVGRLDILTDKGVFPCTAFIVSDKHILTAHHCVPGILANKKAEVTEIIAVQFVAGYTQQGVDEGTRKYTVIPVPVETSKELDYSVLEVLGDPSEVYGKLTLSDELPEDGDPFWIIGHPMGEAQRISREKCKANTPALSQSRILHICDTLPGNSGSPVIDVSTQKVVGLHHAGSKRDGVNFAIPMREILSQSTLLAAMLRPEVAKRSDAVASADNDASYANSCDAFYNEAKKLDQCYAYNAYVESCASHPYIRFARGYLDSKCSAETAVTPVDVVTKPKDTSSKPSAATIEGWIKDAEAASNRKEYKRAYVLFRNAADAGDQCGQYRLGDMYEFGRGQTSSTSSAVYWYKKAVAQNGKCSAVAKYALDRLTKTAAAPKTSTTKPSAVMVDGWYRSGVAAYNEQRYTIAANWFQKAATQGDSRAQTYLGYMYENGKGVTQSYSVAVKWYRKAATAGHGQGQCNLALRIAWGQGAAKNQKLAAEWTIKSLQNGADWCITNMTENATVREIQKILKQRGLYSGAIDGSNGPNTQAAMRKLLPN